MHLNKSLKQNLMLANLYFLLAKKYEYVDPAKHMHYYKKHFHYVTLVEKEYLMYEGQDLGNYPGMNYMGAPMY